MSDVNIQTSVSSLQIRAGGQASFQVRLAARPEESVTVRVRRRSGDTGLSVVSGASLSFSRRNYGTWQTVTLRASEGTGAGNGQATLILSGDDLRSSQVTVTVTDNDTSGTAVPIQTSESSVQIQEGGRATFNVRLASRPSASVTVTTARVAGDSDITVVSGASLAFRHQHLQHLENGDPGCSRRQRCDQRPSDLQTDRTRTGAGPSERDGNRQRRGPSQLPDCDGPDPTGRAGRRPSHVAG